MKEAVANGRLTGGGDQPALVEAAAQRGLAPDTLAVSAALAQPWADIVLSGAVSIDMLSTNMLASPGHWDADLARSWPLSSPDPRPPTGTNGRGGRGHSAVRG